MKGERNMLQGENDRVQGENKRFWKGGKEKVPKGGEKTILKVKKQGFEGGAKRDGEKNIVRG